ncbi:Pogo transposable element with KRAB domain [Merluccius polli]|uniref:Pogo transposable element with KRAB domain n=1 Tax=Merluccius polli TaxID=89951 RepID=A0AA47P262_MERPO|nr:Pogo transposable element with KRAB domain [Merluccius polli]
MPRVRVRMTNRGVPAQLLERASIQVQKQQTSIRKVAKDMGIPVASLARYLKRKRELTEQGYKGCNAVFTAEQELSLATYIRRAAALYYGLPPKEVRKLAVELALHYKLNCPEEWKKNGITGPGWFTNYMKRHPRLSIRRPQATSLLRNSNFNEVTVGMFFEKLATVYQRHQFEAKDIWNVDETGLVTVQKPGFMVATKGIRRVGAVTSGERGTLITMALAGNALGNIIPPHFVFPRKKYLPHFIRGGPEGSIGTANGSGWMQEDDFVVYLRHFVHYTRPTDDNKVLLLLDNHSSHVSIQAINFCRDHGVVMLSFPPPCTHHLQPLDKAVYGPLKRAFNGEMDMWHRKNAGESLTIYDLPQLLSNVLLSAASPLNVKKGFTSTGIWPYKPDIFTKEHFAPALVTDRAPETSLPSAADIQPQLDSSNFTLAGPSLDNVSSPEPATSTVATAGAFTLTFSQTELATATQVNADLSAASSSSTLPGPIDPVPEFSPEVIRPHPKAGPRKKNRQHRKKRTSAILTDTPEKEALEEEKKQSLLKVKRKIIPVKKEGGKKQKKSTDDSKCLVCGEWFSRSKPGEQWVSCCVCRMWSHAECTTGGQSYICHHCE